MTRNCFKTPTVHSKASKESLDLTIPSLGELGVKWFLFIWTWLGRIGRRVYAATGRFTLPSFPTDQIIGSPEGKKERGDPHSHENIGRPMLEQNNAPRKIQPLVR